MSFKDDIDRLAEQVRRRREHAVSEEAVKQALILPFLATLGYDVYDPSEVQPEWVADFAVKKAGQFEKVDYAIRRHGTPIIFVEAKKLGQPLDVHDEQLARYFNATPSVRVGVLTNGVRYRFFTDLRQPNMMDAKPFFEFDLDSFNARDIEALTPFRAEEFSPERIVEHAEELSYVDALVKAISEQLRNPSETFVRFVIRELDLKSVITAKVVERFQPMVRKAIQVALLDLMTRSLQQEIAPASDSPHVGAVPAPPAPPQEAMMMVADARDGGERGAVTTEDELRFVRFVQEACRTRSALTAPVEFKDSQTYLAIHCGRIGWWFLRAFFGSRRRAITTRLPVPLVRELAPGFEVEESPSAWGSSRLYVEDLDHLHRLTALVVRCYEEAVRAHVPAPV